MESRQALADDVTITQTGEGKQQAETASFLGTALIIAAKEYGATGIGIEIDPFRAFQSKLAVKLAGVSDKIKIRRDSFWNQDISDATVVFMYLIPKTLIKLRPKFLTRALGPAACEKIWQLRREFSYALRDTGLTKLNEDIVVPRGRLDDLFAFAGKLEKRHGLPIACFGHAGDGNIHVNVMLDLSAPDAKGRSEVALDDLFKQVLDWGGVITGEHGIGLAKKKWWPLAANAAVRELHRTIKHALDPNGILNPGKFV